MSDRPRNPLLGWAILIAPAKERAWLEDMRLEHAFVRGRLLRLRWALAALGLALRWRLSSLARPWGMAQTALASLLTLALVAVLLVVPSAPTPRNEAREALPSAAPAASSQSDDANTAEQAAAAPAAPSPAEAEAAPDAVSESEFGELDAAPDDAFILSSEGFTLVAWRSVTLTVTPQDPSGPSEARVLEPSSSLELRAPVLVETDDAGGLEIFVNGESLGAFGADGEAATRRFVVEP